MDDKQQWAWSRLGNDYANGPFLTREEAIDDAMDSGEHEVHVGHVEWVDPAQFIDVDLDTMIESTEERAHDQDGWAGDDALIEVRTRPGTGTDAAEQLALALQTWASEWLRPASWRMADGSEVVKLAEEPTP